MSKEHNIEQRKATRYDAEGDVVVTLNDGDIVCYGQLKDVSDSGVFVLLDIPPEEDWVHRDAEMHLTSTVDGQTLEIIGDVYIIRATARGLGMYIQTIHKDTRMAFVKFMVHVRYTAS